MPPVGKRPQRSGIVLRLPKILPVVQEVKAAQVRLPDGTCHEMATFTTLPWDTVEECLRVRELGREIAKNGCLRTVDQWQAWHLKFAHGK